MYRSWSCDYYLLYNIRHGEPLAFVYQMAVDVGEIIIYSSIESFFFVWLLDDNVGPKHSCSSPKDLGNKENICTVQEDNLDVLASSKKALMRIKRAERGRGYDLRKSLAWNQAFFMEEGIKFSTVLVQASNSKFSKFYHFEQVS